MSIFVSILFLIHYTLQVKKIAVHIAICTHFKFVFVSQPLKSIEHGNSFFSFMRAPKKVIFRPSAIAQILFSIALWSIW